jgi:hypothetical protein
MPNRSERVNEPAPEAVDLAFGVGQDAVREGPHLLDLGEPFAQRLAGAAQMPLGRDVAAPLENMGSQHAPQCLVQQVRGRVIFNRLLGRIRQAALEFSGRGLPRFRARPEPAPTNRPLTRDGQ